MARSKTREELVQAFADHFMYIETHIHDACSTVNTEARMSREAVRSLAREKNSLVRQEVHGLLFTVIVEFKAIMQERLARIDNLEEALKEVLKEHDVA